MMRFRAGAFLLLTLGHINSVSAQAVLTDVQFVPPTFYVGDAVELRIDFELDGPLAVDVPDAMPESDWVEIRDISLERSGDELTVIVDFIPFAPGTRTLPAMELGSLQLRDIKIPTRSVLSGSREGVRALRGQLLLPGTRLAVAVILTFIAMAPFIGFGAFRLAWRQVTAFREAWRVGRPARRLKRLLKSLKSGIGTDSAAQWYAMLTEALRTYMSARIGHDCTSATTAEIALMEEFRDAESPPARLLEILKDGDMVKFAGRFADDRSLNRTLDSVDAAVQDWERGRDRIQ